MAFTPSFLEELKERIGLVDVVGAKVALKKRGREHMGLCPFHHEKTPSFTVSEEKGFFHCFGCGAHGTAIDFVMRTEGLSFPEAIERLAVAVGLPMPQFSPQDREEADRLAGQRAALEAATQWFQSQLAGSVGRSAADYLKRRGVDADQIEAFQIGYAPNRRTGCKEAMLSRDLPEQLLVDVGLLIRPEQGGATYDRFRDRVIFPITDRRGRVIAFGGRALSADQPAKYLNSPETELFHKGNVLYNHAKARSTAHETRSVIVAEGYMDVIALARAGYMHSVAPLGTAVTERQLAEIWRMAAEPVLCLDGDAAGWRAATRAAERALPLLKPGYSLRFALLPEGQDPDDIISAEGTAGIDRVLAAAIGLDDLLWRMATENRPIDTPERRAALEVQIDQLVGRIGDDKVRHHYQRHMRGRLWSALNAAPTGRKAPGASPRERHRHRPGAAKSADMFRLPPSLPKLSSASLEQRREEKILSMLLVYPNLIETNRELIAELSFVNRDLDSLRSEILNIAARAVDLDFEMLKNQLEKVGYSKLVSRLAGSAMVRNGVFARNELSPLDVMAEWHQALARYIEAQLVEDLRAAEMAFGETNSTMDLDRLIALWRDRQSHSDSAEADLDRLIEKINPHGTH